MAISQMTEFGRCSCGGLIGTRSVKISLAQADGENVELNDVVQGSCPECGSRYYKADTLKMIEDEFRRVRVRADADTLLGQG